MYYSTQSPATRDGGGAGEAPMDIVVPATVAVTANVGPNYYVSGHERRSLVGVLPTLCEVSLHQTVSVVLLYMHLRTL